MIRFLLELFKRTEYPPEGAIPASVAIDQEGKIISKISTVAHPTTGYWIDWGGTYDNPTSNVLQLYFDFYLNLSETILTMITLGNSMYRDTDLVYFSTTFYPWQYPKYQTELSELNGFSSASKDSENPSDDIINGSRYPTKFQVPSLQIKLPDAISGSALQNETFTANLENSDGKFDLSESNNFFNVPVYILKSYVENPVYSDFQIIRRGYVDDQKISFSQFSLSIATTYRSLSEDVSRKISIEEFPNVSDDNLGKIIPVGWGVVNVEPVLVDTLTYLFIDPDYYVSVIAVYDSDDVAITPSLYSVDADGLLIMDVAAAEPARVNLNASASNRIGEIIPNEIQEKSRILYAPDVWDITESDIYKNNSPKINLLFESGSVKDLIAIVLKSDNAFLIEKSDGRLSIRKWGNNYTTHTLKPWIITKEPNKDHINSKYFASTTKVIYSGGSVVDSSRENAISETFRKKQTRDYTTHLASKADALLLASDMLDRFGQRPEVFNIPVGQETSQISILDKVIMDININGRLVSNNNIFIVKKTDVAQDVLTLESFGKFKTTEGLLATPSGLGYSGDMSGAFYPDSPAELASVIQREDF